MKIERDILEFFRAILTISIFVGAMFLTTIFSIPFLGTPYSSHQFLVENSIFYFLFTRLVVLAIVTLLSFSLLYFVGRVCKKKTSKKAYLTVFLTCLVIAIWLAIDFLNDYLWNYVPMD
ncbi:MAG: hypothetical protein V4687_03135 [Bacteroidota bacterium]